MNDNILNRVTKLFSGKRNIILIPHSSPDADALGSCLALYHFFNQENEYKRLIDHLTQQKVDGIVIGINGYGSRKIVPVLKKVIQRINIVVHLIEEKSTSVICSSCGFRKIKKGKFIKCHRCKEVIHRDTNAAINILKRFEKGNWGSHDDPVLRRKRRKFKKNNS